MADRAEETVVKPSTQWWIGPVKGSGIFQKCFIGDISGSEGSHWIPSWIIENIVFFFSLREKRQWGKCSFYDVRMFLNKLLSRSFRVCKSTKD